MSSVAVDENDIWHADSWLAEWLLRYIRNFPAHRGMQRIFKRAARILFNERLPLSQKCGARIAVDPLDYIGHAICFYGAFEPHSLALACDIMKNGGLFVDVGANFGLYTCRLSAIPNVECVAVDASPLAFAKLQHNVSRNLNARITTVNVALGAKRSFVTLQPPVSGNLGTTRVVHSEGRHVPCGGTLVACVSVSELLEYLEAGQVKLLKIDVEGFELDVLQGLDFRSSHAPEHIITEHCPDAAGEPARLTECVRLLTNAGYAPFTVLHQPHDPQQVPPEHNLWWRRQSESQDAMLGSFPGDSTGQ